MIKNKVKQKLLIAASLLFSINLQAEVCSTSMTESAPASQFTLSNDGTAIDTKTDLIWKRCFEGQVWDGVSNCTGTASSLNWQEALDAAENSTFANRLNWRLPNIKELAGTVEDSCSNPAFNVTVFPGSPITGWSWSSTPDIRDAGGALVVNVGNGYDSSGFKENVFQVRLVRGGQ